MMVRPMKAWACSRHVHARKEDYRTLAERAATVAGLEEAADEIPFVASASPGTAVRAAWDKDWTAYTSENLFKPEEKAITDSPGRLSHHQVPLFDAVLEEGQARGAEKKYTERDILESRLAAPRDHPPLGHVAVLRLRIMAPIEAM